MSTVTTTTGAYSGINTADIIDKLMAIDQKPLDKLNQKKSDYQNEISSYGEVSSAISTLRTAVQGLKSRNIASFTVTSSDETVLKGTAGVKASAGNYSIEVTQLAQDQKISSKVYSSDKEVFKTGTLTVRSGANTATIDINYKNNTLTGIKDAINSSGVGIRASIIKDSSGYRLVVTAKDSGASGAVTIVGNDLGPTGQSLTDLNFDAEFGVGYMSVIQKGQDAAVKIDGLSVTSKSNTLTDTISGLTIDLKKAAPGQTVQLSVSQGSMSESANIKTFVDSYNAAVSKIKELTADGKPLEHDRTVRAIKSQLENVTTNLYGGASLARFGISHDKYGVMQVESSKLDSSVAADQGGFYSMMDQLSSSFDTTLKNVIIDLIPARKETINRNIKRIDEDASRLTASLEKTRESYVKKFAAMEATIAALQNQSTSMQNQLSNNSSN